MNLYHVWFNLKPGVRDMEFARHLKSFLSHLEGEGRIAGFRLTRCKLGLRPSELREFHLMIETKDLTQLDAAFTSAASREGLVERLHAAVNQSATDVMFALYRDFPDEIRVEGEEQF